MTVTLLEADGVWAGYPGRPEVLQDCTLSVAAHTRMVLLGANGSGKSTLLRCLAGALKPARGSIRVKGAELRQNRAGLRAHRRQVQLVLQDPDDQLFSADVFQDVSFGPTNMGLTVKEIRTRVEEALELLGVAHLTERATHQLSYGERKRVATAGAVAMRPHVLLLDEPTAGLDPVGVQQVRDALTRLHEHGTTLIVATHDVDFAWEWADEAAVVVDAGVQQADPVTTLGNAGLVARAHLQQPWALLVAQRLGLDVRPRDLDTLVAAIKAGQ